MTSSAYTTHSCRFDWCTGTIWPTSHRHDGPRIRATGRREDVVEDKAVTVVLSYDEAEDTHTRILLHLGSGDGGLDVDVCPTPEQARRVAIELLQAAEAAEDVAGPLGGVTFTSRTEAIQRVIVDPIEASGEVADARATYDVEAIAAKVLGGYEQGYRCLVDADTFWRIVAGHNRRPVDSDIR